MSAKRLKQLLIALGVLVALWIGSEVVNRTSGSGVSTLTFATVDAASVDSVVMSGTNGTVRLVRTEASWSVNGFEADTAFVVDLLETFGDEIRADVVARNAASHDRFDLGDDAHRITVYVGDAPAIDLLVGKRGRDFQTVFVRRPDEAEVYGVRTRLASLVDRRVDDWRDKHMVALDPDSIRGVKVARGRHTYTLTRRDEGGWLVDGEPANDSAADRLLEQFRKLDANSFASEAERDSAELDHPDRLVTLLGSGNATLAELRFDSTATGFRVAVAGRDPLYRLDRFKVDQLTPADSTVRSPATGTG